MDENYNPNQDLLEIHNRYERIEAATLLIDNESEDVEKRKRIAFEKLLKLEEKSIQLPADMEGYIAILVNKVEERKALREEWRNICNLRVEMDKYTAGTEEIIQNRGDSNPNCDEKKEIELLIKQYIDISIKKERILDIRGRIQNEEKQALSEIEKIIEKAQ